MCTFIEYEYKNVISKDNLWPYMSVFSVVNLDNIVWFMESKRDIEIQCQKLKNDDLFWWLIFFYNIYTNGFILNFRFNSVNAYEIISMIEFLLFNIQTIQNQI